eukprot:CAMPEP_0117617154 /NCGR_PEP_ID=MMETSP0784-20121206/85450_1 /TAXON_ID=39447 /ORGANISM="" /LENGTH=338 /DNA_ID=CAMNT_0005420995 /DNA_START=25 /DNA_END=1043 /DNA_ORIENTATION=-
MSLDTPRSPTPSSVNRIFSPCTASKVYSVDLGSVLTFVERVAELPVPDLLEDDPELDAEVTANLLPPTVTRPLERTPAAEDLAALGFSSTFNATAVGRSSTAESPNDVGRQQGLHEGGDPSHCAALALLDLDQVGAHQLLVFQWGNATPTQRFDIGPQSSLVQVRSMAEGAVVSFNESLKRPSHSWVLLDSGVATKLLRDFRVRQRLATYSSRAARTDRIASLAGFGRQRCSLWCLWRFAQFLVTLVIVSAVLGWYQLSAPFGAGRARLPLGGYVAALGDDANRLLELTSGAAAAELTKHCEQSAEVVLPADVQRCMTYKRADEVRGCLQALTPGPMA